jgi:hypothetical protein
MEMFQTKVVEKIKTHSLCSVTFFENLYVYEIMWKSTVERGRPQMKIRRVRIARLQIHTVAILTDFPQQQW